jgi:hypothetical protein
MRTALAMLATFPLFAQSGIDLSMPESPALHVLGSIPTVIRPATPREFTVSLLNGIDQTELSIDIGPYWLAAGHLVDRKIYKANPIVRLLAGTQLSLATVKSSQAAESSRLVVGMQIRIFDLGDARLDGRLADCLQRAAEKALASSAPCREGYDCQKEENARREALRKSSCRDEARARNWNRSSWAVGGAKDTQSAAAWSSLAYGFEGVPGLESTSQFILQWSRLNRHSMGGLRLRMGGVDTHLSAEWIGQDGQSQFSLTGERKIGENLWLEVRAGGVSSQRIFVLTSFHWGLARQ